MVQNGTVGDVRQDDFSTDIDAVDKFWLIHLEHEAKMKMMLLTKVNMLVVALYEFPANCYLLVRPSSTVHRNIEMRIIWND